MPSTWLIDACCLLNILASGYCEAILRSPRNGQVQDYTVAEIACNEVLYLRRGGNGEDADTHETVDLEPLFASGLLRLERLETVEETEAFVALATQLDDGEAATCALALQRDYGIVTDDRKARHLLASGTPAIDCVGTLELLKAWSDAAGSDPISVAVALRSIRDRARYIPPRSDPLRLWWDAMINS